MIRDFGETVIKSKVIEDLYNPYKIKYFDQSLFRSCQKYTAVKDLKILDKDL